MTVAARLLAFAVLLAGVFAAAAFAGGRVDLGESTPAAHARSEKRGHAMSSMADAKDVAAKDAHVSTGIDPVRGLAVSEDALTLRLARTRALPGKPFELSFRVVNARGRTVRHFDVEHTTRMHLIVARRDLTAFQHLHPGQAVDGSWSVPVRLNDPGAYRVFADFSTNEKARTLGADLAVDGDVSSRPLPPPAKRVAVDGMKVALRSSRPEAGREAALTYKVTRNGQPMSLEPYLGARGHLVALREGDLAFLHVHPDADRLRFMAQLPSEGRYRLFLQFKTRARVHTAAFTQVVTR